MQNDFRRGLTHIRTESIPESESGVGVDSGGSEPESESPGGSSTPQPWSQLNNFAQNKVKMTVNHHHLATEDGGCRMRPERKGWRWCFVLGCKNTGVISPNKMLLQVPEDLRVWELLAGQTRSSETLCYQYDALIGDGRAGEEAPSCERGVHVRTCRCTPHLTCASLSSNGSLATHQV